MTMLNEMPDVLSVAELCTVLRIGRNTAYDLVRHGVIRSIKIGRVYKVPRSAVNAFIQGREG